MRRELLISLEEHFPNLKLDLEMGWGDPSTLQSSPLTHSIHACFAPSSLDTIETSPPLTHVQTQIMDSPNLVELSMKIGSMGCVIYNVNPKFAQLKNKRFPPLEKLSLVAFPLTVENVDYWMTNMDWSHMKYLDLRANDEPTYFFNESMKLRRSPAAESVAYRDPLVPQKEGPPEIRGHLPSVPGCTTQYGALGDRLGRRLSVILADGFGSTRRVFEKAAVA